MSTPSSAPARGSTPRTPRASRARWCRGCASTRARPPRRSARTAAPPPPTPRPVGPCVAVAPRSSRRRPGWCRGRRCHFRSASPLRSSGRRSCPHPRRSRWCGHPRPSARSAAGSRARCRARRRSSGTMSSRSDTFTFMRRPSDAVARRASARRRSRAGDVRPREQHSDRSGRVGGGAGAPARAGAGARGAHPSTPRRGPRSARGRRSRRPGEPGRAQCLDHGTTRVAASRTAP